MRVGAIDKTIRGVPIRVGPVEIVPLVHITAGASVRGESASGWGESEPVGLEIRTPEGTRTVGVDGSPIEPMAPAS